PMSPTWTTKSRRSRFMSSIRPSSRCTSLSVYGVSPSTPNARPVAASCAQPQSRAKNRDRPRFPIAWETSDAVGLAQQRERMRLDGAIRLLAHALHDVAGGDRAVGAHIRSLRRRHEAEHRPADFHRIVEVLGLH